MGKWEARIYTVIFGGVGLLLGAHLASACMSGRLP